MAPPHVPEYRQYFNPLLQALKSLGGSATIDELDDRISKDMKLSEEVLAVPHDPKRGGKSKVAYRIAWARTYLKAAGLITNSERGVWALTAEGAKVGHVDEKKIAREVSQRLRTAKKPKAPGEEEELGEDALQDWQHELLELLHQMRPDAFERLGQRVLREAGFVEVEVTGKSGDGGIDGVGLLRLQQVLTFRVFFQCKRLRDSVTSGTVRDFRGAMQGRSDKGLIITTSYFTRDALREATRDGAPAIDLIDGEQLVGLLKKLGLGVKTELVERVTVEPDWFKGL